MDDGTDSDAARPNSKNKKLSRHSPFASAHGLCLFAFFGGMGM